MPWAWAARGEVSRAVTTAIPSFFRIVFLPVVDDCPETIDLSRKFPRSSEVKTRLRWAESFALTPRSSTRFIIDSTAMDDSTRTV